MSGAPLITPPGGWRGPGRARIAPITGDERGMISNLVDWGTRRIGKLEPRNIFLTLQRAPRLFWPWMLFVTRLMPYGKIHAHDRERVILRVAWLCRSEYEWGQHVEISAGAGLPATELPWIAQGPSAPQWPTHQRLLMQAVEEFHADRFVSDDTWNALAATYPPDVMIELMMLIGHYEMLAGVLNSVGVEMER